MTDATTTCGTECKTEPFVASQVPFEDLCNVLDRVRKGKTRPDKLRPWCDFVDGWRRFHASLHVSSAGTQVAVEGDTFFPALRLVLPQQDRDRPAYGLKESALGKLYVNVLGLSADSKDGRRLLNYRAPMGGASRTDSGDFAAAIHAVLEHRCPSTGRLSIADINAELDAMAAHNSRGGRADMRAALQRLLHKTSALQHKWLVRMMLKELRLGLGERAVLAAFHRDAPEAHSVLGDLSRVCRLLHDPATSYGDAETQLGAACRPMLAQRAQLGEIQQLMGNVPFYIETKLDGERVQLHKDGNSYRYFSRNSFEFSNEFGTCPRAGTLTPFIQCAFAADIHDCILDGEMMVFDSRMNGFITKGGGHDVKKLAANNGMLHPCFCAFDLLYLNGKPLSSVPLHLRLQKLHSTIAHSVFSRMVIIDRCEASAVEEVTAALNDAIDAREEGIILKQPSSVYKPGKRGHGWLKIKPEYVDGLCDDLDLLIVGGYWGKGQRRGMVSHFLCAVAEGQTKIVSSMEASEEMVNNPDEHAERGLPQRFVSLCRVGSGWTMRELADMGLKLAPHWKPLRRQDFLPSNMIIGAERPEVLIDPEVSVVVQVRATEITSSKQYGAGMTLRFPRIVRVRDDRAWNECTSLAELRRLQHDASGKLATRHVHADGSTRNKLDPKHRKVSAPRPAPSVPSRFKGPVTMDNERAEKGPLLGLEFCILSGTSAQPKAALENAVMNAGGSIVQNPGPETYCVVLERVNLRGRNLVSENSHDLITASWLVQCLDEGRLVPWEPKHVVHLTPASMTAFSEQYDVYGDSFQFLTDEEELQATFRRMVNCPDLRPASFKQLATMEQHYGWDESPLSMFRGCTALLESCGIYSRSGSSPLDLSGLALRFHGGKLAPRLDGTVTHVLVPPACSQADEKLIEQSLSCLRTERCHTERKFYLLRRAWVDDSVAAGHRLEEVHYLC
uniref:DNA ligase 4 isoform X2 n=1 Tax=Myxine glutinosa TaxID=7769 RepID=UPI00358EDA60